MDIQVILVIVLVVVGLGVLLWGFLSTPKSKAGNTTGGKSNTKQSSSGKSTNKNARAKHVAPKSVQRSIPYTHIFANGVIETTPGVFTKAYKLEDANFKIAPDNEQIDIFKVYSAFLNSFPKTVHFQIIVQNHATNKHSVLETVRFLPLKDGLNKYRSEMNAIMVDRLSESRNNLAQDKLLVVSIEDDNADHAMQVLEGLDSDIDKGLRKIIKTTQTAPLTLSERLWELHSIYNQDGTSVFANAVDENGKPYFDLDAVYRAGLTTKDIIAPSGMQFTPSYFKIGETYGKVLYLENIPTFQNTDFLADLSNVSCPITVSIHYEPIDMSQAIKMVRNQQVNINAQVASHQKTAARDNVAADLLPDDLARSRKQVNQLMDDIISRDQKLFYITFVVAVYGSTKTMLDENVRQVVTIAARHRSNLKTLLYQQESGLNASLALGLNKLQVSRLYTTESAAVYIPYTSQEMFRKNGIYYGLNQTTNNLIVYSRMEGRNYNGLIFGESGGGKSFTAKCEMMSVLLRGGDNVVYVIDPEGEYKALAEMLDGEVIELSPKSKTFVNPLDMDIDYGGDGDPVAMKADYIISLIDIMKGKNRSVTPKERSIIDRCVLNVYKGYLEHMEALRADGVNITCDKDAMPTLVNLYHELLRQPEDAAQSIATDIESFALGSSALFAHRSNVETNKRFVVYDISGLGSGMKNIGLHICLNDIWNKMIANRAKGIWTWFYIDEFYLLLQSESAATFLMQIWKRARKWNGVPTGIMQNTEDLLRSADSRQIINNTSFVIMLSLPQLDRITLSDLLQIPDSQLTYITNSRPGSGLLYNGKTILPFKNDFPKDTEMYKVLSTSASKDALTE